jgi:hypothetical protein
MLARANDRHNGCGNGRDQGLRRGGCCFPGRKLRPAPDYPAVSTGGDDRAVRESGAPARRRRLDEQRGLTPSSRDCRASLRATVSRMATGPQEDLTTSPSAVPRRAVARPVNGHPEVGFLFAWPNRHSLRTTASSSRGRWHLSWLLRSVAGRNGGADVAARLTPTPQGRVIPVMMTTLESAAACRSGLAFR